MNQNSMSVSSQHYLLTVKEVAYLLRTSSKAIYTMKDRNLIPGALKIGKRLLFNKDVIMSWLEKCTQSPKEDGNECKY